MDNAGTMKADKAAEQIVKGEADEKPKASFTAVLGDDGVMRMELNLNAAVESEDKRMILSTFILEMRDRVMALVFQKREAMDEQRRKIIQVQNKNGHKNFINRLFK